MGGATETQKSETLEVSVAPVTRELVIQTYEIMRRDGMFLLDRCLALHLQALKAEDEQAIRATLENLQVLLKNFHRLRWSDADKLQIQQKLREVNRSLKFE